MPKQTGDGAALVTRRELAAALDCHPDSIARWIESGLPVARRGKGGRPSLYNVAAARAWKDAHEQTQRETPDLIVSRARKELAQAIEAEQRVAIRAKTLVHIDDIEKTWSAQVAAVRASLLALPTALSDKLARTAALEGPAGVERVLEATIHQTLSELAAAAPAKPAKKTKRASSRKRTRRAARGTPRRRPGRTS